MRDTRAILSADEVNKLVGKSEERWKTGALLSKDVSCPIRIREDECEGGGCAFWLPSMPATGNEETVDELLEPGRCAIAAAGHALAKIAMRGSL